MIVLDLGLYRQDIFLDEKYNILSRLRKIIGKLESLEFFSIISLLFFMPFMYFIVSHCFLFHIYYKFYCLNNRTIGCEFI